MVAQLGTLMLCLGMEYLTRSPPVILAFSRSPLTMSDSMASSTAFFEQLSCSAMLLWVGACLSPRRAAVRMML